MCLLSVSKLRRARVSVQCEGEVKRRREETSGQSECTAQAPREWVGVAPRGHKLYWAEVIELT